MILILRLICGCIQNVESRMRLLSIFLTMVLSLWGGRAFAISVGTDGSASPFEVNYQSNVQSSIDLTLQVVNDSDATNIFSWQLAFKVLPTGGATGELLFQNTFTPPSS